MLARGKCRAGVNTVSAGASPVNTTLAVITTCNPILWLSARIKVYTAVHARPGAPSHAPPCVRSPALKPERHGLSCHATIYAQLQFTNSIPRSTLWQGPAQGKARGPARRAKAKPGRTGMGRRSYTATFCWALTEVKVHAMGDAQGCRAGVRSPGCVDAAGCQVASAVSTYRLEGRVHRRQ